MGRSRVATGSLRAVAVAVGVAIAVAAVPSGADAGPDGADGGVVAASQVPQPPDFLSAEQSEAYWTLDRMRAARPVEERVGLPIPASAAAPEPLSEAKKVPGRKYKKKPYRMFGKVFFSIGGGDFVCSGTSVKSTPKDLVLTAGHCVFDNTGPGWYDNLVFVPAFRGWKSTLQKAAPFGVYPAVDAFVRVAWQNGDFSVDFAFVEVGNRVNPMSASGQVPLATVQQEVSAHKIKFNQPAEQKYKPHGWPAAAPFDGNRLYKCKSNLMGRDPGSAGQGPDTLRTECNMTGGSSGGGWLTNVNARKKGTLLSVVSYGYPDEPGFFYGPYFGDAAADLYGFAETCSSGPC